MVLRQFAACHLKPVRAAPTLPIDVCARWDSAVTERGLRG